MPALVGVDSGKLAKWEGKVPDVSLEETAKAYRAVVDELDLEVRDHEFDGRVVEHRATWPTGPFGDEADASVSCSITGKKDGVILSVGVEGSQERLQEVLRALERRGVPLPDEAEPNP